MKRFINRPISPAAIAALRAGDEANFVVASTPGGIEAQERAGQAAFVASSKLPRQMTGGCTREKLEQMGVVFGNEADDLFVHVTLPPGWRIQPSPHSMWSHLLDDKGRERASIFYKAAFYDRSAHISLNRRYDTRGYCGCDAEGNDKEESGGRPSHFKTVVTDCGKAIEMVAIRAESDHASRQPHYELAVKWLAKNFPNWKDPLAYWDEET